MLERQIADFVEEERAPSASSKRPWRRPTGTGERALLVPEELALDQAGRQRGAIHPYQRARPATAAFVHSAGKEFLAGARFAEQQDRRN